jgi:hypothetical protein
VIKLSKTKRELTARQKARKTRKVKAAERRAAEWIDARGEEIYAKA